MFQCQGKSHNDNHYGVSRLFFNIETRRLKSFSSISQDDSTKSALIANSSLLCLPSCNSCRTKQIISSPCQYPKKSKEKNLENVDTDERMANYLPKVCP